MTQNQNRQQNQNTPPYDDLNETTRWDFYGMWGYRLSKLEQLLLYLGGLGFLYFIHYDVHFVYYEGYSLWDAVISSDVNYKDKEYEPTINGNWGFAGGFGAYTMAAGYNYWISNV
jgi:hypothetical protein